MPGEAAALSHLHRYGAQFESYREADEPRSSALEDEYLDYSLDPFELAFALERALGVERESREESPEYLDRRELVKNWQSALEKAAHDLFVQGKTDRLFERYWSIRKGKGIRRPTSTEADQVAQDLEKERDEYLHLWVNRELNSGIDLFIEAGETIARTLREPGEAREIEYRTAQLALIVSYAHDATTWAARAGGRALRLATLADNREVSPASRWMLARITTLYIDGHDTAVIALARAALESALVRALPNGVAQAELNTEREEITLQERIDIAFRRKKLTKDQRDMAHQIRRRANDVLHGEARMVSAEESLGIVTALASLLKVVR